MLSVVIPTHNRSESLRRTLDALAKQTLHPSEFEVVVVADTCTDGTADWVSALDDVSFPLRLTSHDARSAARSRNVGAEHALGEHLVFLDDDVEPSPEWLAAHRDALRSSSVVVGYSSAVLPENPSWWQLDARMWWEDRYREMRRPGHRFNYRDVFSGNLAIKRDVFFDVGGFDARYRRIEDYELGLRLIGRGTKIRHEPNALAWHHESVDLPEWLGRLRAEGHAEVQLAEEYPEFRGHFFGSIDAHGPRFVRSARRLAMSDAKLGRALKSAWLRWSFCCESLRLRSRWREAIAWLREYHYWSGVSEALGGRGFASWVQDGPLPRPLGCDVVEIDLLDLPPPDLLGPLLSSGTRNGLRIRVDDVECLVLGPEPGVEPIGEAHLRGALRDAARNRFVPGLALAWAKGQRPEVDRC